MHLPAQFTRKTDAGQRAFLPRDYRLLHGQPRQGQIGPRANALKQSPRFRPGHDQGGTRGGHIAQVQPGRQVAPQHLPIMPLGGGGGDQQERILAHPGDRHLGQNPAPVIGKIAQGHAAHAWQGPRDPGQQPVRRPRPDQLEPGEAGQVEHPHPVTHRLAFRLDPGLPRARPLPGLRAGRFQIIARLGVPIRPLPTVIDAKHPATSRHLVMQRRQFPIRPRWPARPWKMHRIFMAIGLDRLGLAIGGIGVIGKPAGITRPHIPFGLPGSDPFRQHLARTPGLGDAKGKHTSLECIPDPRHRADQGQAIGGIGDRAIDHLAHPGLGQNGHAGHRILHIPFQPLQIVGE